MLAGKFGDVFAQSDIFMRTKLKPIRMSTSGNDQRVGMVAERSGRVQKKKQSLHRCCKSPQENWA